MDVSIIELHGFYYMELLPYFVMDYYVKQRTLTAGSLQLGLEDIRDIELAVELVSDQNAVFVFCLAE